ncbi:hypothetical protein GWI33_014259, partial [Rhynchophorus ferrugineus]
GPTIQSQSPRQAAKLDTGFSFNSPLYVLFSRVSFEVLSRLSSKRSDGKVFRECLGAGEKREIKQNVRDARIRSDGDAAERQLNYFQRQEGCCLFFGGEELKPMFFVFCSTVLGLLTEYFSPEI